MTLVSSPGNPVPDGAIAGKIKTPDGIELRFARWDSPASSKGTVCVFGGRGEFIEKYFETVSELRRRGFAVATMDWRGQGHSSRQLSDPRKGHVESFSDYEIDVERSCGRSCFPTVRRRILRWRTRWAVRPCCGPRIPASGGSSAPFSSAPMIDFPGLRASWPLRLLLRALRHAGFGERYVPGGNADRPQASRFDGNPLTSDPQRYARNAAIIAADPALGIGSPTVAWLDAAFDAMVAFRAADYPAKIVQPTLLLAAGADSVVSTAAIERFAARLPAGSYLRDRWSEARNAAGDG